MNFSRPSRAALAAFALPAALFLLAALPTPAAFAAEAAEAAKTAYPAFEASSELFELVGRIKAGRMTLTLDRWASNEPVVDARIEIDSGGRQLVAEAQADGSYALDAAPFADAATYPLAIAITAGAESDLLAADLVVDAEAAAATPSPVPGLARAAAVAGALALLTLLAAAILVRRRRRASGEHA